MHAEDRRSPRRHVSRLGTRAPALPHCPRCSRSVPWCCPRSGHLPLCSSHSHKGRTTRYLRRLELLSEPRPGPPRCPIGGRVELHTAPLRCGTALLTCPLDHRRSPHAAHSFSPVGGSPEEELPQRPPLGAATHRHRPLLDPQLRSKSTPSEP
jgi:hypothetical protein